MTGGGNPYSASTAEVSREPVRPRGRPSIVAMIAITFVSLIAGICFFVCSCFGVFWAGDSLNRLFSDELLSTVGPVVLFGSPFVVAMIVGRILWKVFSPTGQKPSGQEPLRTESEGVKNEQI